MAWIRMIDPREAEGELAALLEPWADPETGEMDQILQIHSLDPKSLEAHLAVYRSAMTGSKGLPRADREMIAIVVSRENDCHY